MKNVLILLFAAAALCGCKTDKVLTCNPAKDFEAPVLLSKPDHYDPLDYNTFPVYDVKHTIAPIHSPYTEEQMAIWLTPKATYLVRAHKQLWNMMYFSCSTEMYIRDRGTGKEYPIKETIGLPMDTTFWVKGIPGEWMAFVSVFPPLPDDCTSIDLIGEKPKEHIPGTTGWTPPLRLTNLSISDLIVNQEKMKFQETIIVE